MSKLENQYPLVAGYLVAMAMQDARLADRYSFHSRDFGTEQPLTRVLDEVARDRHDVYGLSCYVWNMSAMRRVIATIRAHSPQALIVLGGPEVMNGAETFLDDNDPRTIICNGEGEEVFVDILRAELDQTPLHEVAGVTAWADGALVTAPAHPRIRDLNQIPSPYLMGLFPGRYDLAIIETNRGCPFSCSFCFWGAANNDKVFKFDEERVRDEITLIARNRVPRIFVADANWGMLKRDVELTRHIVACKEKYSAPLGLLFSTSKNSPARVAELTGLLTDAGLVNTQTISLQSMSDTTLRAVDRQNIRTDAYLALQDDLNAAQIGSFVELIWPLPGETLDSFHTGLAELIRSGAQRLVAYPNMLLRNTPMRRDRERLGLTTVLRADDYAAEEFVDATAELTASEVRAGQATILAAHALFNARTAATLMAYLDRTGQLGYDRFLPAFADYALTRKDDPFGAFMHDTLDRILLTEFGHTTEMSLMILHQERGGFTRLLRDFCTQQPFWSDPAARLAFEFDIFMKPFMFSNTLPDYFEHSLSMIDITDIAADMRSVTLSPKPEARKYLDRVLPGTCRNGAPVALVHPNGVSGFDSTLPRQDLFHYGNGFLSNIQRHLPESVAARMAAE